MPLTIAHLSDIHLPPLPPPRLLELAPKRLLALANWTLKRRSSHGRAGLDRLVADVLQQRPDHIVVTGDVVNLGLRAEFAAALQWLKSLGGPDAVTVIPGNHDAYVGWRRQLEYRALAAHMSDLPHRPRPHGRPADGFPFVRLIGPAALVGLSSAVPTPPFFASGRLGRLQLQRLAELLDELRDRSLVRVVLIHHPPLPGQADRRRGLDDAAAFAEVIGRHGAELVLHGHMHRPMLAHAGAAIPVVGVTAARSLGHGPEPAGYNLVTIDGDLASARITIRRRSVGQSGDIQDVAHHEFGAGSRRSPADA